MKLKIRIIIYALAAVCVTALCLAVAGLSAANGRLRENQNALLAERDTVMLENCRYRTEDSLNAVKVTELRLTLAEYKKHRENDLAQIKKLKVRQNDLENIIKAQAGTVMELTARLADTVTPAGDTLKCFEYRSRWTDVSGCFSRDTVEVSVSNREELTVVETVRYKRFLGFLWKTKRIKSRQVDIVSGNPATVIVNVDAVHIEK